MATRRCRARHARTRGHYCPFAYHAPSPGTSHPSFGWRLGGRSARIKPRVHVELPATGRGDDERPGGRQRLSRPCKPGRRQNEPNRCLHGYPGRQPEKRQKPEPAAHDPGPLFHGACGAPAPAAIQAFPHRLENRRRRRARTGAKLMKESERRHARPGKSNRATSR